MDKSWTASDRLWLAQAEKYEVELLSRLAKGAAGSLKLCLYCYKLASNSEESWLESDKDRAQKLAEAFLKNDATDEDIEELAEEVECFLECDGKYQDNFEQWTEQTHLLPAMSPSLCPDCSIKVLFQCGEDHLEHSLLRSDQTSQESEGCRMNPCTFVKDKFETIPSAKDYRGLRKICWKLVCNQALQDVLRYKARWDKS